MAMDDLFKSLSIFQSGVQRLAVNSGIQQASQKVEEINSSVMDEIQKRQAKQQLAAQMAMQLTQAGADPQQIQQTMGIIQPAAIKTSQDAYTQAVQTGDKGMMGMAKDMQKFESTPDNEKIAAQGQNAKDIANINGGYALAVAGMRNDGKGEPKLKTLTQGSVDKITNLETALKSLDDISNRFETEPGLKDKLCAQNKIPGVSFFKTMTDADFADFKAQVGRDFDQYKVAITGAGATNLESANLRANRPTEEDKPEAFAKKLATIQRIGKEVRDRTITNFGKAKYDISGFSSASPEEKAALQPVSQGVPASLAPTGRTRSYKNKETGLYEVWKLDANGNPTELAQ